MSLALLNDDLDFTAKLLISLFNLKSIVLEPRVEAAANVKKRHVGFGQGGEIIERLRYRPGTVHARILGVDAGNLVRIFDGPRVDFAGAAARAFHCRLLRKAVSGQVFIRRVPILHHEADPYGAGDDVKPFSQQLLIDLRVTKHKTRPVHPGHACGGSARRDHHGGHRRAVHAEFVAVVARRKKWAAAGDVSVLIRIITVEILAAVVGGPGKLVAREGRRRTPYRAYALLNKVRDGLGVAQAMGMMGVTFLDHHRDASAELLKDGLDGGSILAEVRIDAAADLKNRHIGRARSPSR